MRMAGFLVAPPLGVVLAISTFIPHPSAEEAGLSSYQGAWLAQGPECAEVYSSTGKGPSFKTPLDIFAPAFIVAGNRLRTPMASCRIKSVRSDGEREVFRLSCANAVAGEEVKVLMATMPDGSLRRYFNDHDKVGTPYQRCLR